MRRQKLRQMRTDRDRPDAGAAAAVRDAECLVKVEVRHVRAEFSRSGQTHQGIEIRAVDVDLSAVRMDDVADLLDPGFEHAVRRRISDHDRRQVVAVSVRLRPQVAKVDVAVVIARDDHDLHAGHLRGCGIGAVRGCGNQANVAHGLPLRGVIGLDDQESGVFALRARVRLQRHGGVSGRCAQHALEARRSFRGSRPSGSPARTDACARIRAM